VPPHCPHKENHDCTLEKKKLRLHIKRGGRGGEISFEDTEVGSDQEATAWPVRKRLNRLDEERKLCLSPGGPDMNGKTNKNPVAVQKKKSFPRDGLEGGIGVPSKKRDRSRKTIYLSARRLGAKGRQAAVA